MEGSQPAGKLESSRLISAADALRRGHLFEARDLIAHLSMSGTRTLLEARVALRLEGPAAVSKILESASAARIFKTPEERALAAAMGAVAAYSIGNNTLGELLIKRAKSAQIDDDAIAADVWYYIAYAYITRKSYRWAEDALSRHAPTDSIQEARALLLRGFACAGRDDLAKQIAFARRALALLLRESPRDGLLIAIAAHSFGALLRELPLGDGFDLLLDAERTVQWTPEMAFEQFQILRVIGWIYALKGEYVRALLYLGRSKSVARTAGQRLLSYVDTAYVAHYAGEQSSFLAELGLVDEALCAIDWTTVREEEVMGLVCAAEVVALRDPEQAILYLGLAKDYRTSIPETYVLAHGQRFEAFWYGARSAALRVAKPEEAVDAARRAYDIFRKVRYEWRAGKLALDLHDMTGDHRWLERAAELLERYPKSAPARECERRRSQPRLAPRQQEIFELLHRGMRSREIAARLGLSPYTVHCHVQRLYQIFGVNSRGAFLAKTRSRASYGTVAI